MTYPELVEFCGDERKAYFLSRHLPYQDLNETPLTEMVAHGARKGAAERAIAQQESRPDITELERRKLTDARSMLKTLSRIASSEGKRAAHDAALQSGQLERLG